LKFLKFLIEVRLFLVYSNKRSIYTSRRIVNMENNREDKDIKEWIDEKLKKREEQKDIENEETFTKKELKKPRKVFSLLGIVVIGVVFLIYFFFFPHCDDLRYIYSNLNKCKERVVSLSGVAFTDAYELSTQGNSFYLEKGGYIIEIRGANNIKAGEKITLVGRLITYPIVFINISSYKKEGMKAEYQLNEICEKEGMKVENINEVGERGKLFVTNLTLLNYSLSFSDGNNFLYVLNWDKVSLVSFMVVNNKMTLEIGKRYKVCGAIILANGGMLRIFDIR